MWNDQNQAFQIILDCFGWKRWGKVQNDLNWAFQIILVHFGGKRWEKVQNDQNWACQFILEHFGGKIWKKIQRRTKMGLSELFWTRTIHQMSLSG